MPYILAFKGETPAHGSYCVNGEVKPSCELVTKNQYPTYCNVISGLESAERILQIYSSSSKKVFLFFFPPWFGTWQLYFFFFFQTMLSHKTSMPTSFYEELLTRWATGPLQGQVVVDLSPERSHIGAAAMRYLCAPFPNIFK